jgi:hypothetical protein
VRLVPGQPIEIGPYRMEAIAAPEGYDGALRVALVRPLEAGADLASRTSRLTLASVGLSRRAIAWVLALAVLAFAFLIPAGRVLHLPWRAIAATSAVGDRVWNPGPVILAHQPIGERCSACHEVAFRRVSDGACLECHRDIGDHVAPGLREAALFEGSRCAACHLEHKGLRTVMRDDDRFCIDCHRDLHSRAPDARSRDVADFADAHPAFRLTVRHGDEVVRVREEGRPIMRETNLRFPHAKHLDPGGVRSPDRGRVRLHCDSCHHPDASGREFQPIRMSRDCQGCHRLQFEPAVTTREVPHGKPADAEQVIEEFYANLALKGERDSFQKAFGVPGEGLLRRAGEPGDAARENALRLASAKALKVARDLFEVRVCKTCHTVTSEGRGASLAWHVAPVYPLGRVMPHARFDHRAHASSPCEDCHRVSGQKDVRELSMPTIDDCRKCHGGSRPRERKVTSNCMLCHGFHETPHRPVAAPASRTADAR